MPNKNTPPANELGSAGLLAELRLRFPESQISFTPDPACRFCMGAGTRPSRSIPSENKIGETLCACVYLGPNMRAAAVARRALADIWPCQPSDSALCADAARPAETLRSGDLLGSITIPAGSLMRTGMTIRQPLRVNFIPQPDITAYELASAMPFFFGQPMYQEEFDSLGTAQRHWQHF